MTITKTTIDGFDVYETNRHPITKSKIAGKIPDSTADADREIFLAGIRAAYNALSLPAPDGGED